MVHRILDTLEEAGLADIPVLAGGTIPPQAIDDLASRGVSVHPPGSPLTEIVDAANRLANRVGVTARMPDGPQPELLHQSPETRHAR